MRRVYGNLRVALIFVVVALVAALVGTGSANAASGDVFTWGTNGFGQLGNGMNTAAPFAEMVTGDSFVDLAGGRHHTVALSADGSISTWGWNGIGQLGIGSYVDQSAPVSVSLPNASAVGAGHYHSLAVVDGAVWAWGRNNVRQLGQPDTSNRTSPVQVSGVTGAGAVAGGRQHSMALTGVGTILTWGNNTNGQLGDGTTQQRSTPTVPSGRGATTSMGSWATGRSPIERHRYRFSGSRPSSTSKHSDSTPWRSIRPAPCGCGEEQLRPTRRWNNDHTKRSRTGEYAVGNHDRIRPRLCNGRYRDRRHLGLGAQRRRSARRRNNSDQGAATTGRDARRCRRARRRP